MLSDSEPNPRSIPARIAVPWVMNRAKTVGIMKCVLQVLAAEMRGGVSKAGQAVRPWAWDCSFSSMLDLLRSLRRACVCQTHQHLSNVVEMCPQPRDGVTQVSDAAFHSDLKSWSLSTFVLHSLPSLKMLLGQRMSSCSFHCRLSHCICFGTDLKFCLTSWLLQESTPPNPSDEIHMALFTGWNKIMLTAFTATEGYLVGVGFCLIKA